MERDERTFTDLLFRQFERIGKSLGSARRLEILQLLAQGEKTVEQIASAAGLSIANASQHLRVLNSARLVDVSRVSPYAFYRLADDGVLSVLIQVERLAYKRLPDVAMLVAPSADEPPPMSPREVRERFNEPGFVIVDVRDEDEFRAGHVRRARSIPLERLADRLLEIPGGSEVVVYGRSRFCPLAIRAVRLLRDAGIAAQRMDAGLPEWKVLGYPLTRHLTGGARRRG